MAKAAGGIKKRSRTTSASAASASKKQKPTAASKRKQAEPEEEEEVVGSSSSSSSNDEDARDDDTEQTATEEDDDNDDVVAASDDDESDAETNEDETVAASASDENDEEEDANDNVESDPPAPVKKPRARAKAAAAPKKPAAKTTKKKPAPSRAKSTASAGNGKSAKAAAAATSKTAPAKKRRVRSQEDKVLENAPMNQPFYVETGSEWHSTDVDLDELSVLRSMWELPSACHILWLLQNPLTLRFSHKLLDFEAALLSPATSTLLEDVFTKLLLKKSERDCLSAGIGLKYEWWNKQLREYYMALYDKWYALLRKAGEAVPSSFSDDDDSDEDDDALVDVELSDDEWLALDILKARLESLGMECPLKHKSYAELPAYLRCKILHNLCEAVIDDPSNTEHVRMMEEDDMRVEPLGRDRAGNLFYFFPQFYEERRLYRLELTTREWGLWAKGDAGFRDLLAAMRAIRGRKVPGEQDLLDHLDVIVEQLDDEARERERELEKATKRAILDAIPRKRSMRIQVKQIEQLEQQKLEVETKQQLSMEELADLKRAELLRKVEMDAAREARAREREAERLEQEQRERDAAAAERELRRQRRIEKEQEEEEEQRRVELERQREREARELRIKQRKAAEEAARLQDEIDAVDASGE